MQRGPRAHKPLAALVYATWHAWQAAADTTWESWGGAALVGRRVGRTTSQTCNLWPRCFILPSLPQPANSRAGPWEQPLLACLAPCLLT